MAVGVLAGLGSQVRFYRTVFIEEMHRDYVEPPGPRAQAKRAVMIAHVLRNALVPILTNVVMKIPFLVHGRAPHGSLLGIPGLGSLTVDAIFGNDFSVLRTMVYIGSLLFIFGQVMTDVGYTLVDPPHSP